MKRVLVTGADGFIGYPCLSILHDLGYEVHAVTMGHGLDSMPNVNWHSCDLLNLDAVSDLLQRVKATHLLHLAWFVSKNSEENLTWASAGIHLLKSFQVNGGRRAVFAGTCFEYDRNSCLLNEDSTPLGAHTVYGASKHVLHELVKSYTETVGMSFAWARIFYLYGPRENPLRLVAAVINDILSGKKAACTEGRQVRDYLHVSDVASALIAITDSNIQGAVNVGSGVPVSIRELVHTTAGLLSATNMIDYGAKPMPVNEPMIIVADRGKISNELGWEPQFDLETGLLDTIEWWRKTLTDKKETGL